MEYKIKYILKYNTHSSTKEIIVKNCNSEAHAKSKFFKYIIKKKKNAIAEILEIQKASGDEQLLNDLKDIFGMK